MAVFKPSWEQILADRVPPTKGELFLLRELSRLDNDFEIYFQTHINITHPDIVILRPCAGALIIEVKDWDLSAYQFEDTGDAFGALRLRNQKTEVRIRSPFQQVSDYKDELYKLCPALCMQNIRTNKKAYALVKTAVFFYKASESEVCQAFGMECFWEQDRDGGALFTPNMYQSYYTCWTRDTADIVGKVGELLKSRKGSLFTGAIYHQIQAVLTPSLEWQEQSEPVHLTKQQRGLAECRPGRQQEIKGVAGSGKTLVLASRAVNCFLKKQSPVLILTYNITLRYYIQDKISQAIRSLEESDAFVNQDKSRCFLISHIHSFAIQALALHNIKDISSADEPDARLMERFGLLRTWKKLHPLDGYDTVLIDEAQDFQEDWLQNVKDLFLKKGGELVLFSDEKQNIYQQNPPRMPASSKCVKLLECYRLSGKIMETAIAFQEQFLHEPDAMEQQMVMDEFMGREETRYYDLSHIPEIHHLEAVFGVIDWFRTEGQPISPNDICVISSEHSYLRELAWHLEHEKNIRCATVTETREEYQEILRRYGGNARLANASRELKDIRRSRKLAFRLNPGVMKLCTTHSFKGWEINTVFLILNSDSGGKEAALAGDPSALPQEGEDKLIYTALTRAKKNFVVLNLGSRRYGNFFARHLEKRYTWNGHAWQSF